MGDGCLKPMQNTQTRRFAFLAVNTALSVTTTTTSTHTQLPDDKKIETE